MYPPRISFSVALVFSMLARFRCTATALFWGCHRRTRFTCMDTPTPSTWAYGPNHARHAATCIWFAPCMAPPPVEEREPRPAPTPLAQRSDDPGSSRVAHATKTPAVQVRRHLRGVLSSATFGAYDVCTLMFATRGAFAANDLCTLTALRAWLIITAAA